jgi:HNH endonuclease.
MNLINEKAAVSITTCSADYCERRATRKANGQPVCGMHYQRWWKHGDINYRRKEFKKCIVNGCSDLPRSRYSEYCEKHYMRVRRRGTTELHQPSPTIQHSHGYVRAYAPDHPLTARIVGNYEYQHRLVFYDTHGEGPFRCHWCNKRVTWDDMHVDHLNSVKNDNRPENLVPSCALCNQRRGQERMKKTMRDKYSIKLTFRGVEKTISEWADELGISRTSLKWRLDNGWSVERALTEPRGKYGPKRKEVGGMSKV